MSQFTTGDRRAILRSCRDACATAAGLRVIVAQLRSDAMSLRNESAQLRDRAHVVRQGRRR